MALTRFMCLKFAEEGMGVAQPQLRDFEHGVVATFVGFGPMCTSVALLAILYGSGFASKPKTVTAVGTPQCGLGVHVSAMYVFVIPHINGALDKRKAA